jgi:hypothetical protein
MRSFITRYFSPSTIGMIKKREEEMDRAYRTHEEEEEA